MNLLKKTALVATGIAATLALSLGGSVAANADPIGSPSDRPLRGVGSDTTQDLYNALGQQLLDPTGDKFVSSFNATGTATIKTWSGGTTFNRPDGSSAGVTALRSAIDSTTTVAGVNLNHNDVNYARSSSGANWLAGGVSGSYGPGALTYLPYAADAVTWATAPGSTLPTTIPVGAASDPTSAFTLRNIYAGNVTTYTTGGTTITLHPILPQASSGTRKFFVENVLGLTTATLGANVTDTVGGVQVQENSGAALLDGSYLVPFSVGSWVAQSNATALNANYSAGITDRRNGARLGQVDANAPVSGGVLNTSFPVKRVVFTVVETAAINPANALYNPALASAFVGASGSAYTQPSPFSGNKVFEDFGFAPLPLTTGGNTYTTGDTKFTIN